MFAILAPKSLPKLSQNPTKINEKMVSVAISKKVPKHVAEIYDFSLIFQEADVLKT